MWGEVVGLSLLAGVLLWLLRGRSAVAPRPEATHDLSYEEIEAADELHQAEEDVKERESSAQPNDEDVGDDWGPGTPRAY